MKKNKKFYISYSLVRKNLIWKVEWDPSKKKKRKKWFNINKIVFPNSSFHFRNPLKGQMVQSGLGGGGFDLEVKYNCLLNSIREWFVSQKR